MLFFELRLIGIEKIVHDGNLKSWDYDLPLVEHFAPLVHQSKIYQEWARLYQLFGRISAEIRLPLQSIGFYRTLFARSLWDFR